MLALPDCKLTFVCGPVASGKTHLIKQWIANDNRHVIFDGTGEFLDDKREQIWASPKKLWIRLQANPYYYRIVYQPGRERVTDFGHILNCLWWIDQPKLLVCDEFHEICPCEATTEEVERMLRFARHDKLGFVGASQRIADVHKLFTSGCRMVVLFWTQEARDLDAIEDRWRCASLVENLRPLLHDDVSGVTKQVPQCVVCMKGHKPFIYDFATDAVVSGVPSVEANDTNPQQRERSSSGELPLSAADSEEGQESDTSETSETL